MHVHRNGAVKMPAIKTQNTERIDLRRVPRIVRSTAFRLAKGQVTRFQFNRDLSITVLNPGIKPKHMSHGGVHRV